MTPHDAANVAQAIRNQHRQALATLDQEAEHRRTEPTAPRTPYLNAQAEVDRITRHAAAAGVRL